MRFRNLLLLLGTALLILFAIFTYTVNKELWTRFDFDFMVKLQNHIPRGLDPFLSVFSYLGEADFTVGLALIIAGWAFFKKRYWAALGWLGIIPATLVEVFGKLLVYHPSPSSEFLRTVKTVNIPEFTVHTDFSYPSGHVTRTIFLVVVALLIVWTGQKSGRFKTFSTIGLLAFIFIMILSRISLGEHWLSDVLGGIILGCSLAFFSSILILKERLNHNHVN